MLNIVWLFVTPWTVARQAPLSTEFSRQEYWSELPLPPPEHLPNPGIEPALAGGFFATVPPWKHKLFTIWPFKKKFADPSQRPEMGRSGSQKKNKGL